jgi:hypothetical protein
MLVPVPEGAVTTMRPVVEPAGTTVVICVGELTVNVVATPLNVTAVAPVKLVPVRTTAVPAAPKPGAKEVTVGGVITVKLLLLVPVPAELVTLIRPV